MRKKILTICVPLTLVIACQIALASAQSLPSPSISIQFNSTGTISDTSKTPPAPTSLLAKLSSANSVTLSWNNTSSDTISFNIYRSTSTAVTNLLITKDGNSNSYIDYSVPAGTYIYSITACSASGCSPRAYFSPQMTILPPLIINQTMIPSGGSSTVTTSTTALPTNSTQTLTATSTVTTQPATSTTNTQTTQATSLGAAFGTSTMTATPSTQTVPATIPTAPSRISVTPISPTSIYVSWGDTSDNETGFKLLRYTPDGAAVTLPVSANTTSYQDSNLVSGVNYRYSVSSCNSVGCSIPIYTSFIATLAATTQTTTNTTALSTSTSDAVNTPATQNLPAVVPAVSKAISNAIGTAAPGSYVNIIPVTGTSSLSSQTSSDSYKATASRDGSFAANVPDGSYLVESTPSTDTGQRKVETTQVTVINGKVADVKEVLKTGIKKISGTVLLSSMQPVTDAEVDAYKKDTGQWITATTDQNGQFNAQLDIGSWVLTVTPRSTSQATWMSVNQSQVVTFSNDNTNESKVLNFVVSPQQSTLTITVTDDGGNPLSNVGVIVDTRSGSNPAGAANSTDRRIRTGRTDINGTTSFLSTSGVYYVRVSIPENLPYITPDEQTITLLTDETKTIAVAVHKETHLDTVTVSGTTRFDDGTPTNGFVSAWSNQGGHEQMTTLTNGSFVLNLAKDQNWHIKANKDDGNKSYKTTELSVDTSTSSVILDLVFTKNDASTLPSPVIVNKNASDQVTVLSDDGAQFSLPGNAATNSGQINVEIKPTTEAPSHSASDVVSTVYDITVKNTAGQKVSQLTGEAEIQIPYDDNELKAKNITVESLIPSYFDETIGTWVPVTKYTVNKDKHVVVVHVNHLTRFALIAAADVTPPQAPTSIVTDAITPTDVRISWQNPTQDFNHSKVYRSDTPGTLGNVVAAEVYSNLFTDKTYSINGKTYYYTVRSVDAAGNESTNNNQIAFTFEGGNQFAEGTTSSSLLLPPGQASAGEIVRVLSIGSKGDDVTLLQKVLKVDGFYVTGPITGYFGPRTQNAVARFQNYYKQEVLFPVGLKVGTGIVGKSTRKKINDVIASELH